MWDGLANPVVRLPEPGGGTRTWHLTRVRYSPPGWRFDTFAPDEAGALSLFEAMRERSILPAAPSPDVAMEWDEHIRYLVDREGTDYAPIRDLLAMEACLPSTAAPTRRGPRL